VTTAGAGVNGGVAIAGRVGAVMIRGSRRGALEGLVAGRVEDWIAAGGAGALTGAGRETGTVGRLGPGTLTGARRETGADLTGGGEAG
jgi:hypothetical protein